MKLFSSPQLVVFVLVLALMTYMAGLLVPIMEPDAAAYAEIAREMVSRGDFFTITYRLADYLDKPHFPFWCSALAYLLFGVNAIAYKLPGILFALLGVWYTYRLGAELYSKRVGTWAALMLLASQHFIFSNNDVRAEPFLIGLIMLSFYHLLKYSQSHAFKHLLWGCVGAAGAIMTKGLFTLIPIATGLMGGLAIQKKWRRVFDRHWLIVVGLTLLLILPVLWAYYGQFDAQPEKVVDVGKWGPRTNVSGIKFFLWDSQFGRFLNVGPIRGEGNPAFFIHTLLWAFLPWGFLFYLALVSKFWWEFRKKQTGGGMGEEREWFILCAALPMFAVFSLSRFQLPHYLNILFPFFALLVAEFLIHPRMNLKTLKLLDRLQAIVLILVSVFMTLFMIIFKPGSWGWETPFVIAVSLLLLFFLFFRQKTYLKRIIFGGAVVMLAVNYLLNRTFFPALMTYQAGHQAAAFLKAEKLEKEPLVALGMVSASLDFYLQKVVPYVTLDEISASSRFPLLVYTGNAGMNGIKERGMRVQVLTEFQDFPITKLNRDFIRPETRGRETLTVYILKVFKATNSAQIRGDE